MESQSERPVLSDMCKAKNKKCRSERRPRRKRRSIISALLLAVLMAGCAAATAPCETQTPELPPQAEAAMDSEGIGEIQKRLLDIAFDNEYECSAAEIVNWEAIRKFQEENPQYYPTVSEEGIVSEEIGEIQKRLMNWDK